MNNRKGFTLIELLGVIAITGLVLALSIFGIFKIIDTSKTKAEEVAIDSIEKAAITYSGEEVDTNWKKIDGKESVYFCTTIGELVNKGLIKEKEALASKYKKEYDRNSFVIVSKNNVSKSIERASLILTGDTGDDYVICSESSNYTGEKIEYPTISGGTVYTDEIVEISYTDAVAASGIQVGTKQCFYGTTVNNMNNVSNSIIDEQNQTCTIRGLTSDSFYYTKVCMKTNEGNFACSNSIEYKTLDLIAPTIKVISDEKQVTISYNNANIKGDSYNYFKSPIDGIVNNNCYRCVENNGMMQCTISPSYAIEKDTWYKTSDDSITITYDVAGEGNIEARIYDKTGNYNSSSKEIVSHIVTFKKGNADMIGDSITDVQLYCLAESGKKCKITSPTITRENYVAVGWNTKSTATTSSWDVETEKEISKDATYYPITKVITYTVTYDANGGTNAPAAQTKNSGQDLTLTTSKPTKTGYTFSKWNTSADGSGTNYSSGGTYTYDESVTLYAQWTPSTNTKYTVNHYTRDMGAKTYTLNSDLTEEKTGKTGATVTLANLKKTISGFTYDGGYVTGSTTRPTTDPLTTTTILADGSRVINLYYRRNYLYVKYHVNGGEMDSEHGSDYDISSNFVTYKDKATFWRGVFGGYVGGIKESTLEASSGLHNYNSTTNINLFRTGYHATASSAWNTKADGSGTSYSQTKTDYEANGFAGADLSTGDKTVTLYVNWKIDTFTVKYDANGGSGAPSKQIKEYGVDLTLSSTVPENSGFKFIGWGTSDTDTTADYQAGGTYTKNENITLYAIWKEIAAPVASVTSTSNLKATKQTATLSCTDNAGIVGYYWGTTAPTENSTYTTITSTKNMSLTKDVTSSGTHYLACKDNEGNISNIASKVYYSYDVSNMLLNSGGKKGKYTNVNYTEASKYTYIAPKSTTLVLTSIYTVPTYSNASRFVGGSTGAASETAAKPSTSSIILSGNKTYTMWFNRNFITFNFKTNGGTIKDETTYDDVNYQWTTDNNGLIFASIDGADSTVYTAYKRQGQTELNLENYNGSIINITKTGYKGVSGAEWKCDSGCKTSGMTITHAKITDFNTDSVCDLKTDSCTVVLKVNWTPKTYTVSYNCNGGSNGPDSQTATYDSSFTVAANTCTKTGNVFTGWTTNTDGTDDGNNWTGWSGTWKYDNGQYGISGDKLVLRAMWNANDYNIKYTLNNGKSGTSAPTTTTYGKVIQIDNPTKTVTVTGKVNGTGATVGNATSKAQTFAGWTPTDWNANTAYYGSTSTTVTTKWSSSSTKVKDKYFKNLRSGSGTVTLTANWTAVAFNLPTVSKPGYTCKWNTKSDGTGTSYNSGASYTPSANGPASVDMYAICTDNTGPTISAVYKIGSSTYSGGWTNKRIDVAITYSDSGSGIKPSTLAYKIGSGDWNTYTSNTNTSTYSDYWSSQRDATIYYRICDNSNNCTTTSGQAVKIDVTAPTYKVDLSTSTTWCTNKVVKLTCSDTGGSGMKSAVMVDNGTTTSGLLTTSQQMSNRNPSTNPKSTVVTCTDNAGNSSTNTYKYTVVTKACSAYETCTDESFGCKEWNSSAAYPCSCKEWNYTAWQVKSTPTSISGRDKNHCTDIIEELWKAIDCTYKQNYCKCGYWTRSRNGCKTYNTCTSQSFGCKTWNSSAAPPCNCKTYNCTS